MKDLLALPPGKDICAHCNGYGSSLLDPPGVDTCVVCGGSGLVDSPNKNFKKNK